jgi:REP element-mobilizing transposase RayT
MYLLPFMRLSKQTEQRFQKRGGARPGVPHRSRPPHKKACPVHVTLRASRRLPSLRKQSVFGAIRSAFAHTTRSWFRIAHFSVQGDHVHLLVEADDKTSLSRGLAGAAIRWALAVNRVLHRRGRVWADRYHARALRTPREVRIGLVYVLMNWRKHDPSASRIDPCSSASRFMGWKAPPAIGPPDECDLAAPETWLLRTGWKRYGLIGANERPRGSL